jgi:hypothetical protein
VHHSIRFSYRKYGKGSVAIAHLTRERVSIPHRALICERMKYSFRQIRALVGCWAARVTGQNIRLGVAQRGRLGSQVAEQ